jgi:hypothetical protein
MPWRSYSSSPGRGKTFLFSTLSRQALGPTQPHIQWVPRALAQGVKRTGCEADHRPPTGSEVKKTWSQIGSYTLVITIHTKRDEPDLFIGKQRTISEATRLETNNPSWIRTHLLRIDRINLHWCFPSKTKLTNELSRAGSISKKLVVA